MYLLYTTTTATTTVISTMVNIIYEIPIQTLRHILHTNPYKTDKTFLSSFFFCFCWSVLALKLPPIENVFILRGCYRHSWNEHINTRTHWHTKWRMLASISIGYSHKLFIMPIKSPFATGLGVYIGTVHVHVCANFVFVIFFFIFICFVFVQYDWETISTIHNNKRIKKAQKNIWNLKNEWNKTELFMELMI